MSEKRPIACNPQALSTDEWAQHQVVTEAMLAAVLETQVLDDGLALRFPTDADHLTLLSEFIARERLCCPFLRFTLDLECECEALWLRLTGQEGVRELLLQEFATMNIEE